jgi:hypothetical protein
MVEAIALLLKQLNDYIGLIDGTAGNNSQLLSSRLPTALKFLVARPYLCVEVCSHG